MNELALFAGAGGGILGGLLLGWRTVCAVELDEYCRRVLMQRQDDGILEPFPIWDDVTTFRGDEWRGLVDVVSAGFPCTPWSVAGKREGAADSRNLWPDTARVIREVRPRWVLLENVPGLAAHPYFVTVIGDLAALGFSARWDYFTACSTGAPHVRRRLFIIADSERDAIRQQPGRKRGPSRTRAPQPVELGWWATESPRLGMDDGMAPDMERLRAIGNGQVPRVVAAAWEAMTTE